MGSLRAASAAMFMLAACSSNNKATVDAPLPIDAPPDAPPDAPIDAPAGDFSCLGATAGTTAADPITIGGIAGTFGTGGLTPVKDVVVDVFKTGVATKIGSATSDDTGTFLTGDLVTGGTPLSGFLEATLAGSRTTFLFPSIALAASVADIPVPVVDTATFDQLTSATMIVQDDTANGAMLVLVTDCVGMRLDKAELSVKQGGVDQGTVFYLGAFLSQAIGVYFVFNVPDGDTDVTAKFAGMQFATHTVKAFKNNGNDVVAGSITATNVLPGP